jgi:hypothetical protein
MRDVTGHSQPHHSRTKHRDPSTSKLKRIVLLRGHFESLCTEPRAEKILVEREGRERVGGSLASARNPIETTRLPRTIQAVRTEGSLSHLVWLIPRSTALSSPCRQCMLQRDREEGLAGEESFVEQIGVCVCVCVCISHGKVRSDDIQRTTALYTLPQEHTEFRSHDE